MRKRFKDCPWCGTHGLEIEVQWEDGPEGAAGFHAWCWRCNAEGPHALTEKGAVMFWNRRPPRKDLGE
jgi:hypothetical protein